MTIDDFNTLPDSNVVRLTNYLLMRRMMYAPLVNLPAITNPATARVQRFIEAHQQGFPARIGRCRWTSLAALLGHMKSSGPNCSEADVAAAIDELPNQTQGVGASWNDPSLPPLNTGD
jgi:hypothetical protein